MKPTRSTPTTKPGAIAVAAENEIDPAALHMPPVIEPEALVLPRSSRANTNQASQAISSPPPMQNVTGPDDSVRSNIRDPHQRRNLKNKEKPKVAATTPGAVAVSASIPETTADDDDDNNNTTTTNNNESPNPAKNAKQRKGRRTPAALVPGAVAVSNNDATRNTKSPRAAKKMSNADTPNASSSPGAVRVDGPVGDILAVKAGYAKRATFRSTSSSTSASSTTTTTTTTTTTIGAAAAGSPVKTASTTSQSQTPGATAISGAETTESVLSAKERFAVRRARLGQSKAPTGGDPLPIDAMGVLDDTTMEAEAEVTFLPHHDKTDVTDSNSKELLMSPTTLSTFQEAHHTGVSYEQSGDLDVEKNKAFTAYPEAITVSAEDSPKEAPQGGRRRRRWIIVAVVVLAIIVGIVAAVVSSTTSKSSSSNSPPTSVPTAAPTISSQEADRRKVLIQTASPNSAFEVATSHPNLALEWMASDPVSATLDDDAFVQRFALVNLWYSTNGLDWTLQQDISWLSAVDECDWDGIVCGSDGFVSELNLDDVGVSGFLPIEITLLSQLTVLSMTSGSLGGSLPTEIGQLAALSSLILSSQRLDSAIPSELGMLSQLRILNLDDNSLTGMIPEEVSQLEVLVSLQLGKNALEGSLPLTELPMSLTELDLSRNLFQGSIPASEFGRFLNLTSLTLSRNSLEGGIPTELGILSGLTSLSLDSAQLNGTIPTEIGLLVSLELLNLVDNELEGSIPTELALLTQLQGIDAFMIYMNALTGSIPESICADGKEISPAIDCGELACSCCRGSNAEACP